MHVVVIESLSDGDELLITLASLAIQTSSPSYAVSVGFFAVISPRSSSDWPLKFKAPTIEQRGPEGKSP